MPYLRHEVGELVHRTLEEVETLMRRTHWLAVFTVATLLCCASVPATALGTLEIDDDSTIPEGKH